MSAIATFPAPAGPVDLLVVAGEHSGDEHAARFVRELRATHPELRIAALGGHHLAEAGAQLLFDLTASSVVGLIEVVKHYSFFAALFEETLRWIDAHRPRAVCFVDYPGFNLRLAAQMRERGLSRKGGGSITVLYYISPQIWAWKAKRRFQMALDIDAMAVIFPFERECYADTALPVEFVGHPFVASGYAAPVRYDPSAPVLLLPGSRRQAIGRIFPALLSAHRAFGERDAVVLYPSDAIRRVLEAAQPGPRVKLVGTMEPDSGATALSEPVPASAVLTSSGTMSLHCALAAIPGAIAYRAAPVTYFLGRMLVKVPYLGIGNLLLNEPMYPEFIQGAATPQALADQLRACLHDPTRIATTQAQAARLRAVLQVPSEKTAAGWLAAQLANA